MHKKWGRIFVKDVQIIADRIKTQAKQQGVTVKKLLDNCGLGPNTVTKLSSGADIRSQTLVKIADYLDCSVDYLLGRTETPAITVEAYIGGDNHGVQAVRNEHVSVQNSEPLDEMTMELLKAFRAMSFQEKMEVMNFVLKNKT